jgi:SAM-dependent methyltransferase
MDCVICGGSSRRMFGKYDYWILECNNCTFQFCELQPSETHVTEIYGDHYFTEGGVGYLDYVSEGRLLTAHGERYGILLKAYTEPGAVLDVGSAAGFILKGLQNQGWCGYGLGPNLRMADYARSNLGMEVTVGTLETLQTDSLFQLVSMIQVIAHFFELRKAFQAAADVTAPGGYWLIESWNKDSWMARILGQNWHEYSPPSVLYWFSPRTLNLLAEQFGFHPVAQGRPAKRLEAKHAKSLLKFKLDGSRLGGIGTKMMNVIPDEMVLPYPSFDLFWTLYRKKL